MRICGIIAEYNPFHTGHAYQCACIRSHLEDSAIISVMSGNYVQRGDFAIWEKYSRAALAVKSGGPDLVLELPIPYSLSSAERFAQAGVHELLASGCVTHLSFGSECGNKHKLLAASKLINSSEFTLERQKAMQNGSGYAAACQKAVRIINPDLESLFSSPNDTLAIQYIRALGNNPVDILPITRIGTGHDMCPSDGFASASWLREQINSSADISQYISDDISLYRRHNLSERQSDIMSYLRRLCVYDWAEIPDVSEGLEYRMYNAARSCSSIDNLVNTVSSRRYTKARIRRIILCAWLGITKDYSQLNPQYLRVLAFNEKGREILKIMKKSSSLPIITKPVSAQKLTGDAQRLWSLNTLADDLYCFPEPAGESMKKSPFYHKSI